MSRLVYEFTEAFRIAFAQIRANKMRSVLTALGVIIGIVAVTLMGTAINGIDVGFQRSLAMLGDDVLYVQKWPWHGVEDWWNYQNRPPIQPQDADKLNRIIEATPHSLLEVAVPVAAQGAAVKHGENQVSGVFVFGTTADYARLMQSNPRWRDVLAQGRDAAGFARGLQRAGYATDPHYAKKLISIMQKMG